MSTPARIASSVLSGLLAWLVINSWRPLVTGPWEFLEPLLLATAAVCATAIALRLLRVPRMVVVVAEALAGLVVLHAHFAGRWVPTRGTVRAVIEEIGAGASAINTYTAPLNAKFPEAFTFLAFVGLVVVVAVEVIAAGFHRVSLAALPLLLAVTVPISVLTNRLALPVFAAGAAMFLALLALEESGRLRNWGGGGRFRPGSLVLPTAIGATTIAGAILLPFVVPVSGGGLFDSRAGKDNGNGGDGITLVNPILDLRRDLVRKTHTPLVYARTEDAERKYLRMTVLDQFTGKVWKPSQRDLPVRNDANGPFPPAPGVLAGVPGTRTTWQLQLGATFQTTWLPLPYPTTSAKIGGDWRYDARTLDVVDIGRDRSTRGMSYTATAFRPDITAQRLADATSPPGRILGPNVELPESVPKELVDTAERVTDGAETEYEKLVALQEFFTTSGGFTYSLDAAPGSGLDLLAKFVTTDKVGYCEQFATAMAVMGRILNIPSRVSVGFIGPGRSESGQFVYTSDELHAWPEFYFAGLGWVGFEPTPSTRPGAQPPAYTVPSENEPAPEPSTTTAPEAQPQPGVPLPQQDAVTDTTTRTTTTWWPWLLVPMLLLVGAAPRFWRSVQRRRRLAPGQSAAELAANAWTELRAVAIDHRIGWPDGRSPRETLARVRARVSTDVDLVARLDDFIWFVERARYAPPGSFDGADLSALHGEVTETVRLWTAAMASASGDRTRSQARWLPRSLVDRADEIDVEDPELAHR